MILAGMMTVNMNIGAWADESNQSVLNTDKLENISNETANAIPNTQYRQTAFIGVNVKRIR